MEKWVLLTVKKQTFQLLIYWFIYQFSQLIFWKAWPWMNFFYWPKVHVHQAEPVFPTKTILQRWEPHQGLSRSNILWILHVKVQTDLSVAHCEWGLENRSLRCDLQLLELLQQQLLLLHFLQLNPPNTHIQKPNQLSGHTLLINDDLSLITVFNIRKLANQVVTWFFWRTFPDACISFNSSMAFSFWKT